MSDKSFISPDDDATHIRLDLENAPDIAAEIGHMCVAWAAVEYRVFALFVAITGIPIALARATFFSHFNTRGRIQLLLSVATMVLQRKGEPTPEFTKLESALEKVGKTANARNKYIHDPWGSWNKKPTAVFQLRLGGRGLLAEGRPVKKNDIANLITQIQKHDRVLMRLQRKILPQINALRRRLDKSRSLPLVFSRTELPPEIRRAAQRPQPRASKRKP